MKTGGYGISNPFPQKEGACFVRDADVLVMRHLEPKTLQAALVTFEHFPMLPEIRAVGFDESLKRYHFVPMGAGISSVASNFAFRLPLMEREKFDDITFIGIERDSVHQWNEFALGSHAAEFKNLGISVFEPPTIGQPCHFSATAVDGKKLNSDDYKGKVVIINFWSIDCDECPQMLSTLKKMDSTLQASDFEMIGINTRDSVRHVREFISREQLRWPIVAPQPGPDQRAVWEILANLSSIPAVWVVDRKGIFRAILDPANFEHLVEQIIQEQ